jgi:hypothetical protein
MGAAHDAMPVLMNQRFRGARNGHGHHAFGTWHKTKDSFLKIQRQQRRFWGSSFMRYAFLYLGGKLS